MSGDNISHDLTAVTETFFRIRQTLTQKKLRQSAPVRDILKRIDDLSEAPWPTGYPDPERIAAVISAVREEKFRQVREKGPGSPVVADIQSVTDELKILKAVSQASMPESNDISAWRSRDWSGGAYSHLFALFFLFPVYFLVVVLLCCGISPVPVLAVFMGGLLIFFAFAVTVKDAVLMGWSVFYLLSIPFFYFFLNA